MCVFQYVCVTSHVFCFFLDLQEGIGAHAAPVSGCVQRRATPVPQSSCPGGDGDLHHRAHQVVPVLPPSLSPLCAQSGTQGVHNRVPLLSVCSPSGGGFPCQPTVFHSQRASFESTCLSALSFFRLACCSFCLVIFHDHGIVQGIHNRVPLLSFCSPSSAGFPCEATAFYFNRIVVWVHLPLFSLVLLLSPVALFVLFFCCSGMAILSSLVFLHLVLWLVLSSL